LDGSLNDIRGVERVSGVQRSGHATPAVFGGVGGDESEGELESVGIGGQSSLEVVQSNPSILIESFVIVIVTVTFNVDVIVLNLSRSVSIGISISGGVSVGISIGISSGVSVGGGVGISGGVGFSSLVLEESGGFVLGGGNKGSTLFLHPTDYVTGNISGTSNCH